MIETNPTETRIASVFKDEKGVIIITIKDCGLVDEYDIMDLNLAIRHKCEKKSCLKLVIMLSDWDLTKAAKEMADKEDNISHTKARAIVVSNNIKAHLFNFLKQFNNRTYPQQFFTNREEAYAWLMTFGDPLHNELHF